MNQITEFIEWIQRDGLATVIAILTVYLFARYVYKTYIKGPKEKKPSSLTMDDVRSHSIWIKFDQFFSVEIQNLNVTSNFKRQIAKVILSTYWERVQDVLKRIIETDGVHLLEREELRRMVLLQINSAVNAAYDHLVVTERIPDPAIFRFRLSRAHMERLIPSRINDMFSECRLDTIELVLFHVLNIYESDLVTFTGVMEDVMNSLNGELNGVVWRGQRNEEVVIHTSKKSRTFLDAAAQAAKIFVMGRTGS